MSTPPRTSTPGTVVALGTVLAAMALALAYTAYDLTRFAWTLLVAPLSKAAREARSCRRVQLGYRCHSYRPEGCEECGRTEHRPLVP